MRLQRTTLNVKKLIKTTKGVSPNGLPITRFASDFGLHREPNPKIKGTSTQLKSFHLKEQDK